MLKATGNLVAFFIWISMDIKFFDKLNDETVEDLFELAGLVFSDPKPKDKFRKELESKFNISIFIAYEKEKAVGYKIGFERSKRIYYSWVGGIHPDYRKQGIAKKLMDLQHDHARKLGYEVVSTYSDNRYKPMMIFNLKSGFDICGSIKSTGDDYLTVYMEKDLTL